MANNNIDQLIKNKINDFRPENVTGDWDLFEHMLTEKEADDVAVKKFDQNVVSKVNVSHQTYVHDWSQMQQYLTIIDQRRQAVIIMKSLEAVIVCLLLYTISMIPQNPALDGPIKKEIKSKPSAVKVEMATLVRKPTKVSGLKNHESIDKNGISNGKSFFKPFHNETNTLSDVATLTDTERSSLTENFAVDEKTDLNIQSDLVNNTTYSESENAISTSNIFNKPSEEDEQGLISLNSSESIDKTLTSESELILNQQVVESLPSIDVRPESEFAMSFPMAMAFAKPKKHWTLGAWTSADINTISTPFDKIFSLQAYQHVALNHSAGLSVGRKNDRLSLTSGLSYSRRNYQPRQFVESYGADDIYYFESSLESIKYDFVSIPVSLAYDLYKSRNWSFYGIINMTANVMVNADYNRRAELILGRPSPQAAAAAFDVDKSRFDDKNFTNGILNGGSFSDSYFVSAGIGLGLEKRISEKLSVYVEPSYLHHIFSKDIGIGPNKDRIHSTSLQLGVRSVML